MRTCRFCQSTNLHLILDLGTAPPSNSFLTAEQLEEPETHYPLRLFFCEDCALVQLPEYKKATEIFKDDYVYYSSQSPSNVSHAKEYVEYLVERFQINTDSHVVEIGSNDGYLLQHIHRRIPCTGIDPSERCAAEAAKKGIITIPKFFTAELARQMNKADLICNINTFAHQPKLNDFIEGLKIILKPGGVISQEFPSLTSLIDGVQLDTIYQEHYQYLSFTTTCEMFKRHELRVFDVEEISTHGGSLRIFAQHNERSQSLSERASRLLQAEKAKGISTLKYYEGFRDRVQSVISVFNHFLTTHPHQRIVGYAAAAKGVSFLNYCGVKAGSVRFVVDRSPHKQGLYLPGSRIPVVSEETIREFKPHYVIILAWNLRDEIINQLRYIREWDGRFVTAIPKLEIF